MPVVPSATKPVGSEQRDGPTGWSRTTINFWIDVVLLCAFLALVWVSFMLRFIFPRATTAAGWTLWGYSYDDWLNIQFGILASFMLGILVHVMLHWTWVCGVITARMLRCAAKPIRWDDGTRTVAGVGLLVVIVNVLGVLMALAALMVHSPG